MSIISHIFLPYTAFSFSTIMRPVDSDVLYKIYLIFHCFLTQCIFK